MIRLAVRVAREHADLVLAELMAFAPGGLEEREAGDAIEYVLYGAAGELPDARRRARGGRRAGWSTSRPPSCPTTGARTGAASTSRSTCRALRVRPPWEPPLDGALDVVIEPGQAFGTGSHATTRLTLELLADAGAGGRAGRLGLRERRAGDRGGQARLGAGAGLRRRARVGRGHARGRRGQRRARSRSRAATSARAARTRRPCWPTSSARCCSRSPRTCRSVPDRLIISGLEGDEPDEVVPAFARHGLRRDPPPQRRATGRRSSSYTRARDHARRRPGRRGAARGGRAPHPGPHRPPARRGHRRRRASCSRPRTSSAPARSSSAAPTTRSRRCRAERARPRRRDRLLGQPRQALWRWPRGCTRCRP